MRTGRALIIGAGIAGAATAWWLAREYGWRVRLIEAEPGPARHSSGKNAAIFRSAIAAAPTRRLALETGEFLRRPPTDFSEHELLRSCGLIVSAGSLRQPTPVWAEELCAAGVAEPLSREALRERAPHFRPAGVDAWWMPHEGRIDISALIDAFLAGARRAGAEVTFDARLAEIELHEGRASRARLQSGETIEADAILLASGGWAGRHGRAIGAGLPLSPMRRHLIVTAPDERVRADWPVIWDDEAGLYFRPESAGLLLCSCDESRVDPDRCEVDLEVRLATAKKVGMHLPAFADSAVAHIWSGVRTLSPDDVPVVGEDPRVAGLYWAAGLGGHGMTISYALGRVAAAAIADPGREAQLEEQLSARRLMAPQPARSAAR